MILLVAQAVGSPWYLNPAFLPAATGLFGVIVGGLITAGSSYLLDQRREVRDREKEERDRTREIKRAARLLHYELSVIKSILEVSAKSKTYYSGDETFHGENWQEHYPALAPELSYEQWRNLCLAGSVIKMVMSDYIKNSPNEVEFSLGVVKLYEEAVRIVGEACEDLSSFL